MARRIFRMETAEPRRPMKPKRELRARLAIFARSPPAPNRRLNRKHAIQRHARHVLTKLKSRARSVSDLNTLTLAEARDGLKAKRFSAIELTDAHIAALAKARALNTYVLETLDRATEMAKASDACIAKGSAGPLEGLPLAVKDTFCTKNVRTTACSRILGNFVPTYESTVTAQLWRDGAVMLGKTNNDEFGMGSSNETSFYGPVVSPWRRKGTCT